MQTQTKEDQRENKREEEEEAGSSGRRAWALPAVFTSVVVLAWVHDRHCSNTSKSEAGATQGQDGRPHAPRHLPPTVRRPVL